MTSQQTRIPDGTWKLDPDRTTITASVKKLGFFNVDATLDLIDGTVSVSDGQVISADGHINAASYRSQNAKRNEHITGSDFLDAATHPKIAFSALNIVRSTSSYVVNGTLSLKGKTFPLSFDVNDVSTSATTASFRASTVVNRSSIGIEKLPSFIIAQMFNLTVDAHAQRIDTDNQAEA